jgi:tetratricopeptide (TPR) repeat protein
MQDVLTAAIEMHRSGQLGSAAQLYQKVLAREQENAEALHLLGVLHHQQGNNARAIELISRAVALRPNSHIYHGNLAEAFRASGDFERAAGCCRAALSIWPRYPEALCNLGAALQGMGKHAESEIELRKALELRPEFAVAHNNLGIALRELGRQDEALEQFQRAVELEPRFAPAQTNLGQTLLDRGNAEKALAPSQEAVRLDPNSAALHHNLGNVLRVLERFVDARAEYLEALRLNPELPLSNAHLGLVLQRTGQASEAVVWLKKAVELEPNNVDFWHWLAELHDELEEPGDSIPCWERVIALVPDRVAAHLALGWALQDEGRYDASRTHYEIAIRLQPDSGTAYLNLGGLQEELGQMREAEASFRTALKLQPQFALPHARLATLLRHNLPDEDLAALEARLADDKLAEGPRARLLFALGHALDGRGDFGRAASCVKQSNEMTLVQTRDRNKAYAPAEHERFVDDLLRVFDRDLFERLAGSGSPSRRPVFVFGLPRSGTTLIEQVLSSHSQVHGAGELRFGRRTFESIPGFLGRAGPPRDCVPHLDADCLRRLAGQHLARLASIDGGKSARIVDKMPDNYLYIGLLSLVFPHATFIHCCRDLRDVAVSCWLTDFRSIRWANDPDHIASRYHGYHRMMEHWRRVNPTPIHEVDYADTVTDLESVARRLVAACGLVWEPACLEFYRNERPVRTASVAQVRQPVYQRSVARWKNYEPALTELFRALPRSQEPATPVSSEHAQ